MTSPASTLLVEDDEALLEALSLAFEERGIQVDQATDWDTGLALFRAGSHELVIADYNLPGSAHGLLLLLEVKVRLPSTQLVLISGALTAQAEAELEPLGIIDAYFRKSSKLASQLIPWVIEAVSQAESQTDWNRFADGFLTDPEQQKAEVQRIDAILRASLSQDDA